MRRGRRPILAGFLSALGVGWDEHLKAAINDPFHLLLMPVAGVREQHLGDIGDAGSRAFALGGFEHRLKVAEVGRDGHDLGGDDDLVLVGRQPGRCSPAEPAAARPLHDMRVGVGDVDLPLRRRRGV
jgi:hypothetical protein